MSNNRHNARKAIVQALYQWHITNQDAEDIESNFAEIHDMQNVDRKFFREAMSVIPEQIDKLQSCIDPHTGRDFSKLDPVERAILLLGSYELINKPDVPKRVVINESIELAKTFGADHSYKFVNGVMDKLALQLRSE